MRPSAGDVISGKYRIVRLIGDGGMGAVFEARHEILGSPVALKFLHTELARRPGLSSRFLQEARVSASIQSPHVTRVTDVEQTPDGAPYLVMELLTGENLQQILDRTNRLHRDQAIDFALQILSGLEAAHALGVVHRDLKPDNVFVTTATGGPILKLLDFGIAKLRESREYQKGLTRPGSVMGTPEYMAPEQLYAADRVDHRADIYSIGAILYEMLSGSRPAYGDDAAQIIAQVVQGKVKPIQDLDSTLPQGLVEVVHRAIDPDKNRRFDSALAMRIALSAFAGELSHAGRLAGTPLPSLVNPLEATVSRLSTGLDALPAEPRASGMLGQGVVGPQRRAGTPLINPMADGPIMVPATLPPEPASGAAVEPRLSMPKGVTQEASPEVMQRIGAALQAANPASPGTYGPSGYGSYVHAPPFASPRGSRVWGAAVALLLGIVVTGGLILALVIISQQDDDTALRRDPEALTASTQTAIIASPVTITPVSPGTVQVTTPPPVTPVPPTATPTAPRPKPTGGNPRRDGGADSGAADGGAPTIFTLPFPSSIPGVTLPSALPPLPSVFPFPFPTRNTR